MALATVFAMIALALLWHARNRPVPTQVQLAGGASIALGFAVLPFMDADTPEPVARLFQSLMVLGALGLLAGAVLAYRQEAIDYREAVAQGWPALAPRWPTGLVWLTWFLICLAVCYGVIAGLGAFTDAAITPLVESTSPDASAVDNVQRAVGTLAAVYLLILIPCILMPFVVPTFIAWRYDRRTKAQAHSYLDELERDDSPTGAVR